MYPWPWLSLGRRGEFAAARYLRRAGFVIIRHSYRCPLGEIDLIAREGECLVFVEVRTRTSRAQGEPYETIGPKKQRKLTSLASYYQKHHADTRARPVRFDVVSVVWPGPWWTRPEVRHVRDAFTPNGPWMV